MKFSTDPREENILNRITIQVIEEEGKDRERFDELLRTQHYLKSACIGGRHLRYVAKVDGKWVGILSFSGAAPQVKVREKWIGWNNRQKAGRLGMVVNNSRFLLLTDRKQVPNMASKVLSLCLKRLKEDWKKRWNASILVVESFVDEFLYPGTCYRACGFEAVGMSAGFKKSSRDFYEKHERPKQLYLKELVKGARKTLRSQHLPEYLAKEEAPTEERNPLPIGHKEFRSLIEAFRGMEDSRRFGIRHPLYCVLTCAAVAMLMGANSYEAFEDICKNKLSQPHLRMLRCYRDKNTGRYVAPSDSTFHRVFKIVDVKEFESIVSAWLLKQAPKVIKRLAVDGKVLRSAKNGDKPLAFLSAVTHQWRITLNSIPIEEKSNEIPAMKPLLKNLNIEGSLITADAMHCQQETARLITQEHGANYLFGLKGNQSGVLERAEIKLSPHPFFLCSKTGSNTPASKNVASSA